MLKMLIRNRDSSLSDICEEINGLRVRVTAADSVTGFKAIFALPNPFIKRIYDEEYRNLKSLDVEMKNNDHRLLSPA